MRGIAPELVPLELRDSAARDDRIFGAGWFGGQTGVGFPKRTPSFNPDLVLETYHGEGEV
jgi:hypothetical protein